MKYLPVYNEESLMLGDGTIIVVCGWLNAALVRKNLVHRNINYACIGNLYNANYGITPLIANLMANPCNYPLHILSCTRQDEVAKSTQALYELLQGNYVADKEDWLIQKEGKPLGRVSQIITQEDLSSLNNPYYYWTDFNEFLQGVQKLPTRLDFTVHRMAKFYDFKKMQSKIKPGPKIGVTVEGRTIAEAWVQALQRIRSHGENIDNRQEILNLVSIVSEEAAVPSIPEWVPTDAETLEEYFKDVLTAETGSHVSYTYGSRLRQGADDTSSAALDQVAEVVKKLAADPNSTRGVLTTWVPKLDLHSSQPPCLNHLFVRIVNNKLTLTATFRSHDMYTAYCSNLYALHKLQELLISELQAQLPTRKLEAGTLVCVSQSAHIYDWSFKAADEVIEEQYRFQEIYHDSVGNFLISLDRESKTLSVKQIDHNGKLAREYEFSSHKMALSACRQIAADNPCIKATHLAYLALELQRAQSCLKNGTSYQQDA